jgi:hypothetical protein
MIAVSNLVPESDDQSRYEPGHNKCFPDKMIVNEKSTIIAG